MTISCPRCGIVSHIGRHLATKEINIPSGRHFKGGRGVGGEGGGRKRDKEKMEINNR